MRSVDAAAAATVEDDGKSIVSYSVASLGSRADPGL